MHRNRGWPSGRSRWKTPQSVREACPPPPHGAPRTQVRAPAMIERLQGSHGTSWLITEGMGMAMGQEEQIPPLQVDGLGAVLEDRPAFACFHEPEVGLFPGRKGQPPGSREGGTAEEFPPEVHEAEDLRQQIEPLDLDEFGHGSPEGRSSKNPGPNASPKTFQWKTRTDTNEETMTQTAILEYAKPGTKPELDFTVDETLCTSCGLCAQDCPIGLIQLQSHAGGTAGSLPPLPALHGDLPHGRPFHRGQEARGQPLPCEGKPPLPGTDDPARPRPAQRPAIPGQGRGSRP